MRWNALSGSGTKGGHWVLSPGSLVLACLAALAGCSDQRAAGASRESAPQTAAASQEAGLDLTPADLVRVCKAAQAFSVGRSVDGIKASVRPDDIVRLSYTRDDGKAFRYDCMVEGNEVRTRMIDEAGPGSGPGAWSGRGSTTTFVLGKGSVRLKQVFSDGSVDEGSINI